MTQFSTSGTHWSNFGSVLARYTLWQVYNVVIYHAIVVVVIRWVFHNHSRIIQTVNHGRIIQHGRRHGKSSSLSNVSNSPDRSLRIRKISWSVLEINPLIVWYGQCSVRIPFSTAACALMPLAWVATASYISGNPGSTCFAAGRWWLAIPVPEYKQDPFRSGRFQSNPGCWVRYLDCVKRTMWYSAWVFDESAGVKECANYQHTGDSLPRLSPLSTHHL